MSAREGDEGEDPGRGRGRARARPLPVAGANPVVDRIYAAPGNAGMREFATVEHLSVGDIPGIAEFAERESIDLTVVGPRDAAGRRAGRRADRSRPAGLRPDRGTRP